MKVETENLVRLQNLCDRYQSKEKLGVSKTYMLKLIEKYKVNQIIIDKAVFYDLTKLPDIIKNKLKNDI